MIATTYSELKQKIAFSLTLFVSNLSHDHEPLNSLKEFYKDQINSPRRFEQIDTLGKLLKILEIRDVLSEDNIEPLKEMARRTNNSSDLLRTITDYELRNNQHDYHHYYPENITLEKKMGHTFNNRNTLDNSLTQKEYRIYETIKEQIGSYWCILGRKLQIRECTIDEINKANDDLYMKASKIMDLYKVKADRQNWFIILCHALDNAKREDLTKKIQDIMMMNI
ncbi:uncharacterized protein LOC131853077 [Achroia grisella]|uniref:uncharacterized protein LOC131853077 n=1 Tax=Achroia grisella TaxID=688607 RepID=UPI0027D230F6|nr:uncharacterized protein LOC131853077 [Achroia grisella]